MISPRLSLASPHRFSELFLAYCMTDLSTTTLRGETEKAAHAPAMISARYTDLGVSAEFAREDIIDKLIGTGRYNLTDVMD